MATEDADKLINEIQAKIVQSFELFDYEMNKTVDVREVGTIIRSLGCCPTEHEVADILKEVEEEESDGAVSLDRFLPVMTKIMMERRYRPAHEDRLLKAFQALDETNKGYLTVEELTAFMQRGEEPFKQDELDEMLSQAISPDSDGKFYYKNYIPCLVDDLPEM